MLVMMPSSNSPNDFKSRQSSGGKSFFSRLHRDKSAESRAYENGGLYPETHSGNSSINGSASSRHSHKPSESLDMESGLDGHGLHMTAGVITSIPYDSLSANSKTPIPVDYLPRNDQVPVRREPLPHHLNKGGGDFHQYPAWDPERAPGNSSSHPTGPRPPPHTSQSTLTSVASRNKSQQNNRPGTSASLHNGTHGGSNSNSTADSSSNGRKSFDQASIYSTVSSATRGSSIFSSDNSSRTAVPSYVQDNNTLRPTSSHSPSRQSQASPSSWHPQKPPSFNSGPSFNPEGFTLNPPNDERVIEQLFIALMHKRGWQHLPDQARRQMMAYPAAKKWTLVHQDKLTEWQGEQKRKQHARLTLHGADGAMGGLGRAEEEGSPEWFVRRILDDTINSKQLQSLSVSLRTQPIR